MNFQNGVTKTAGWQFSVPRCPRLCLDTRYLSIPQGQNDFNKNLGFLFVNAPTSSLVFQYMTKKCDVHRNFVLQQIWIITLNKFCEVFRVTTEWRKDINISHYKSQLEICFRPCESLRVKNDTVWIMLPGIFSLSKF